MRARTFVPVYVVCRSGGEVGALPIVESSCRSHTHLMITGAMLTFGDSGGNPAEASANNDVYRLVDNLNGAGRSPLSPVAIV